MALLATLATFIFLPIVLATTTSLRQTNRQKDPIAKAFFQVKEILRTHPHPDVRGEFYRMVLRGDFRVSPQEQMGADAGFVPVAAEVIRLYGHKPRAAFTPVIHVDTIILRPEYKARAQLVLYHEYVHYEQWRDGRLVDDPSLGDPNESDFAHLDSCKKKWYAEAEAYHKTCLFGRQSGLVDQLGSDETLATICGAEGSAFHATLRHTLLYDGASAGNCADIWSTI
jgi:hypothetical protein